MKSFRNDERGAVALVFGLLLGALIFAAGMAVDYGRSRDAVTKLQSSLDAAVLAASASGVPDDQRQNIFNTVFAENFHKSEVQNLKLTFDYTAQGGGKGTAKADVPTTVMMAVGKSSMPVYVESSAAQADFDIEIVMVLDVSGSMRAGMSGGGSRLDALKASAKKLVDIVDKYKMPSQTVKYGIVPFTMTVNIGTDNAKYVDGIADPLFTGTTWAGCVLERPDSYANEDVYNAGGPVAGGHWQAYISPPEPDSGGTCLNPSNGTNSGYKSVDTVGPQAHSTLGPMDRTTIASATRSSRSPPTRPAS